MAYEKNITISKEGREATIKDSSWKVYERNGWTRADDGSSEGSTEPSSAPAESEPESEAPAKKTTTRKKAD